MLEEAGENPPLSALVRVLAGVVFVVVCGGATLLFAPSLGVPRWPWSLPPFNARFLGAIYAAEAVTIIPFLSINRWSPGRVALVAGCIFTVVASIGTLLHVDAFSGGRRTTLWFVAYIGYAVLTALALWVYRDMPRIAPLTIDPARRRALNWIGAALVTYGTALFAWPSLASAFWPWTVDALHAQIYSAVFLAAGGALLLVARDGARLEFFLVGLFLFALGLLAILGLALADAQTGRTDWSAAGTWFWVAMFAGLSVLGAALMREARAQTL
jgi:hypothetical protein